MSLLKAIEEERARLTKRIEELQNQKADIDTQIDEVKNELRAIDAYENAKSGKKKAPKTTTRGRTTGMKQSILDVLKAAPHGLGRAGIINGIGVRGDKSKEQTVSNTLATMNKKGEVKLADGTYTLP